MLRSIFFVMGCAVVLLITSVAQAQVETTPIPLPSKPDFSSMKFLLGTWNCTETNTRRNKAYTTTSTTTMDPSGYWMDTKSIAHPVSFDPTPTVSIDKVTYDGGHWVDISTDDRGTYGFSSSTGWKGDQIVWHPGATSSVTSGNVVGGGDTTVMKVSDTKTTHTGSFKESSGRTVTLKGSCTKQ